MTTIFALIGALALATVPIRLGWHRGWNESQLATVFGLREEKRRFDFDPEAWAAQTGTGLTFRQIAYGASIWTLGGLLAGWLMGGLLQALAFGFAGAMFYIGGLKSRQEERRLAIARQITYAVATMASNMREGRPVIESIRIAADSADHIGKPVIEDLYRRLHSAPAERFADEIREWSQTWQNPAGDMLANALIAALESRIELVKILTEIRDALRRQIKILAEGRAEAKGIEWQAKFLALFPPGVILFIRLTSEMGNTWANPVYIAPTLIGAALSYWLTMRLVRSRLSLEASMGLLPAGRGEIPIDRFGNPL